LLATLETLGSLGRIQLSGPVLFPVERAAPRAVRVDIVLDSRLSLEGVPAIRRLRACTAATQKAFRVGFLFSVAQAAPRAVRMDIVLTAPRAAHPGSVRIARIGAIKAAVHKWLNRARNLAGP
jgi:hypothetical protein